MQSLLFQSSLDELFNKKTKINHLINCKSNNLKNYESILHSKQKQIEKLQKELDELLCIISSEEIIINKLNDCKEEINNELSNKLVNEIVKEVVDEIIDEIINEPVNESINKSLNESINNHHSVSELLINFREQWSRTILRYNNLEYVINFLIYQQNITEEYDILKGYHYKLKKYIENSKIGLIRYVCERTRNIKLKTELSKKCNIDKRLNLILKNKKYVDSYCKFYKNILNQMTNYYKYFDMNSSKIIRENYINIYLRNTNNFDNLIKNDNIIFNLINVIEFMLDLILYLK